MALNSVNDLKQHHYYKYENNNEITLPSSSYLTCYSIGYIDFNYFSPWEVSAGTTDCYFGTYGMSSGNPRLYLRLSYGRCIYSANFKGSFYFMLVGASGDVSALLPYLTEVTDYYIFDRTEADVNEARQAILQNNKRTDWSNYWFKEMKGCFNVADFYRIMANICTLNDNLTAQGYPSFITVSTLQEGFATIMSKTNITSLINKINTIKNGFVTPVGWEQMPTTINDYHDLNIIEKNLYLLKEAYEGMINGSNLSGTFYSGARHILPLGR